MMELQLSYFKSKNMMLLKCYTQYVTNLEKSAVDTGMEKVTFPITKKGNAKECSNYQTFAPWKKSYDKPSESENVNLPSKY